MYFEIRDDETYFEFEDEDEFDFWTSQLKNCAKDGFLEDDMDVLVHCVYELKQHKSPSMNGISSYISGEDTARLFGSMLTLLVGYHRLYGKN